MYASVILEALACEYQKRVIPSYYEISIKVKSVRDDDSIEMIEMMMANRHYDLGDTIWKGEVSDQYMECFSNKTNTFQSVTERIEPKVTGALEKAVEAFRAAGGN